MVCAFKEQVGKCAGSSVRQREYIRELVTADTEDSEVSQVISAVLVRKAVIVLLLEVLVGPELAK